MGHSKTDHLTTDLVRIAAMKMRASIQRLLSLSKHTQPPAERDRSLRPSTGSGTPRIETTVTETIFRGPDSANRRAEIALIHDDYKDDKRHGWLEISS